VSRISRGKLDLRREEIELSSVVHHAGSEPYFIYQSAFDPEAQGMHAQFRYFARRASEYLGSSWAFFSACLVVLVWAVTGPLFGFSDTWQMVINTGTTIVTFLMVFLIQHAQNHDARAMQLKLDELLRAVKAARNSMVDLEERSEEELTQMKQEFSLLSQVLGGSPTDASGLCPSSEALPQPTMHD
jgi:low affinity Fe/Cu permease